MRAKTPEGAEKFRIERGVDGEIPPDLVNAQRAGVDAAAVSTASTSHRVRVIPGRARRTGAVAPPGRAGCRASTRTFSTAGVFASARPDRKVYDLPGEVDLARRGAAINPQAGGRT